MLVAMAAMISAIALQVFFRYVVPVSVPWTEELSIISFIFIVFYGAALASRYDRHLGIRNIVDALDERTYIIVWFVKKACVIAFLLIVMVVLAIPMVLQGWSNTFTIIKIPLFFVLLQMPVFGVLVIFHTCMSILRKDYLKELPSGHKGE